MKKENKKTKLNSNNNSNIKDETKLNLEGSLKINCGLLSFILGVIAYYMYLSYSQVAGGKYLFMQGDMLEIYIPVVKNMLNDLISGNNIFYSWKYQMGMNTTAYLASDGQIFSIPAILFFLNKFIDVNILAVIVTSLKAGLTSFAFNLYIRKTTKITKAYSLALSLAYALCGFMICNGRLNIIFLDAVYMLPIIILLLRKFVKEGKWKLLILSYVYLFMTNFYMGYMVGIFSFIYLIVLLVLEKEIIVKDKIKTAFKFSCFAIIAASMCMVLLMPAAYYFLFKNAEDATTVCNTQLDLIGIYNQLFMGEPDFNVNEYPNIYCSLLAVLILPIFYFNKEVDKKEKKFYSILLGIMLISCAVKPLYLFWHAFDAPDGWDFRFSFIISFIVLTMVANVIDKIDEKYSKSLWIIFGVNMVVYAIVMLVQPSINEGRTNNTLLMLLVNAAFMASYCFLFIYKNKSNKKNELEILLVFLVVVEIVINGVCGQSEPVRKTSEFVQEDNYMQNTVSKLKDISGDDFYRVRVLGGSLENDDLFWDYNGVSDFGSIENYNVRKFMGNMGGYTSARLSLSYSMNDLVKMISGVKYEIQTPRYLKYINSEYKEDEAVLEENPYALSLGFVVNSKLEDFKFNGNNSFENSNQLASCITGKEIIMYDSIDESECEIVENGVNVEKIGNDFKYTANMSVENEDGKRTAIFMLPLGERKAYVQFNNMKTNFDEKAPAVYSGVENLYRRHGVISVSYMKQFEQFVDSQAVHVIMDDNTVNEFTGKGMYLAYYNPQAVEQVYDCLSKQQMKVNSFKNGYVQGTVNIENDDSLLFTSIPYDEGWKVYVDGNLTECIGLLDDAFLGIKLSAGEHNIEFKYEVPLLNIGIIISVCGILAYIILIIISKKKSK